MQYSLIVTDWKHFGVSLAGSACRIKDVKIMARLQLGNASADYTVICFVLVEFRSLRPIRTIAGPGGIIGPLPRPKQVGEPPGTK